MSESLTVFVEYLPNTDKQIGYAHRDDSGLDLHAYFGNCDYYGYSLKPGETIKVSLGIKIELPIGFELQIRPRSSLSSKGILVHLGTVDCGYRGEIKAILTNLSGQEYAVCHGDKIAQGVLATVSRALPIKIDFISEQTSRGIGGFGSTGK